MEARTTPEVKQTTPSASRQLAAQIAALLLGQQKGSPHFASIPEEVESNEEEVDQKRRPILEESDEQIEADFDYGMPETFANQPMPSQVPVTAYKPYQPPATMKPVGPGVMGGDAMYETPSNWRPPNGQMWQPNSLPQQLGFPPAPQTQAQPFFPNSGQQNFFPNPQFPPQQPQQMAMFRNMGPNPTKETAFPNWPQQQMKPVSNFPQQNLQPQMPFNGFGTPQAPPQQSQPVLTTEQIAVNCDGMVSP